jgi:hypothetical protein
MPKATKDRKPRKRSPSTKPQERPKHPPQWEQDLNPKRMEGQNIGANPAQNDPRARTAAEIKSLTERLQDFNMDELAQIPIVPAGMQLKQGAVYLDLRDPAPVPFTATAGIVAGEHNYYTPKAEVPYDYWNRLVETLAPGRVAGPEDSAAQAKPFSPEAAASHASTSERDRAATEETAPSESKVDEALADSFPASDPPAWTAGGKKDTRETGADDLNNLSEEELKEKARELEVHGRESMNREQLILAIRRQLSGSEV